jgi:undecaprenyl pyrophosphate synthase
MLNINFNISFHINLDVPHIILTPIQFITSLHEGTKAHRLQLHHTIFCDANECAKNNRMPQTFKRHYAVCMRARVCVCVCAFTCVFNVGKYKFITKNVRKHNTDLGPRNRI